jgi:outer membrane protein OmpA-like peptidoglycan-associated protein
MNRVFITLLLPACAALAQQTGPAPIYHVTVVERTVKAINYQYRSGPTPIDFRGTILLPKGKGQALVESKQGHTEIDAHFEKLTEPTRFGREYLTYVLWALTPEGRPINLGEVVASHSDKAHLRVTTGLQAFALIVTAEPYAEVRQPSDVVVFENAVRPDTVGKIEEVNARYELLPRGAYAWQEPDQSQYKPPDTPKVSMSKYEELLEVYQAQNALGIAESARASQYAPNTYAKAQQLLADARQLQASKADSARVIETAREAAQTAEDARLIATRRAQEQQVLSAQAQIAAAQQAQAASAAQAAQAQADAERAARERAEAQIQAAQQPAQARVVIETPSTHPQQETAAHSALRMRLLEQLNGPLATRDTPRGLVATVPNSAFNGGALNPDERTRVARIAAILVANPGLRVEVEGNSDTEQAAPLSWKRAEAVRLALVSAGVSPNAVTSRGLGNTRPLASNATPAGRDANDRVEIVISGDPIGSLPFWDHTYPLKTGGDY